MNKESVDLLIHRKPALKRHREKLEGMQPGVYCIHRSWGLGVIRDYDENEGKLIIDFEGDKQGHAMDPAFCVDKLDLLPQGHILVRSRENANEVEAMIKERPTDLIVEILSTYPDQSALTSELEKQLSRLLGMDKYKKWWASTKRLLVKDPRVAVPAKKTEPYVLRDEPVKAEEEILEAFFDTKAPKKKINLADKLISLSVKHEDIKDALPDILKSLALCLQETKQLKPGERLHGIWIRNDLARFIHEDVETLEPTSASLLQESDDLAELADETPSSHHKRFLTLVERVFPDTWENLTFDLLRKSSGKFTTECVNFLLDKGKEERLRETFKNWLAEQSLRAPVLMWIVKNRHSRKYGKLVEDLVDARLLVAIFSAIDDEALQTASTRRIALAEVLSDDGDLIAELIADAPADTAYDLATMLQLNQGFEDLTKKSLLARFIKLFPSTQRLVDREAEEGEERLVVSKDSFAERQREYEILVSEKIPQNKEAIATAREHGDLRENAEYKMARQDQETLLARKSQLEVDLNRAEQTDFKEAPTDVVGIGSSVRLINPRTGEAATFAVLGAWDSNPEENIISYQTPLGQGLLSKQAGDLVRLALGDVEEDWRIESIARWVDERAGAPASA